MPFALTRRRILVTVIVLATLVAVALAGGVVGRGAARSTAGPLDSKHIPNLGLVKNQIKLYYGDYVDAAGSHQASATSPYAREVEGVERRAVDRVQHLRHHRKGVPAIVLDVDDTSLLTYNYEANNDFGYNPTINAQYVLNEQFPAVFGMVDIANRAAQAGFKIFWITGRPASQHDATVGNLAKVGYPTPTRLSSTLDGVFTKPNSGDPYPSYINCDSDGIPACSTTEYKSQTRAYLESLGYDIRVNAGDQDSDLAGGHEDIAVKLPNPMYFIP